MRIEPDIESVLREHKNWLDGKEGGKPADLGNAILSEADLRGADLRDANLRGADLRRADLRRANLREVILPTGERWETYLSEVVPAYLTAGGKSLQEIVASGAWVCHSWSNCPTHAAFGADGLEGVPVLLRPRAEQFIQFFDAGLLPVPVVQP